MTQGADRGERFIGRFENRDAKTGAPNGDRGYIALALSERGRIPQVVVATAATLDELIAELKGPRRDLMRGGKISFEPPPPFRHRSLGLVASAAALELPEIYKVQAALGLP